MTTTSTTPQAAEMTEAWDPPQQRFEQRVELTNAPDLRADGKVFSPYTIDFDFRRVGDGRWHTLLVTIYCQRRYANGSTALIGTCLHLSQLDEKPDWLADLIARATPPQGQS